VWFSFRRYEFKIAWSPHVIFKHRVIFVIKTLLVFRIKLCMLEFDQKYFIKIPFERSISWFQNNNKTKKRQVSLMDEMWSQNKNAKWQKSMTKMLDSLTPSWISYSGNICVLPSNSDHSSFWGCAGDNMIDDIVFHNLSSILETRASVQLKRSRNPPRYSHLVWIIPWWLHAICRSRGNMFGTWQMLLGKLEWQRYVNLWQRHWSGWWYRETWLGKMTEVSQLRVIFWFNSLYSFRIHGRAFNLSHLDS
jgi:hypothetical protein